MSRSIAERRSRTRLALRERRRGSLAIGPELTRCALACADTYRAYRLARWGASDDGLRPFFDDLTRERDVFLAALCRLGGPAETRGSVRATLRRVTLQTSLLFRRNDRLLLEECLRAERLAEWTYAVERSAMSDPRVQAARDALAEQEIAMSRARAQLELALRSPQPRA